jgi:DNA-binding GntR family transcriptional regulator
MSAQPAADRPLAPLPRTLAMTVASELRRMIQSGELAAGTPLRQDELATRFGTSTTPVREALTALAREGLIRRDAHRGAVVFPPTREDIRENFEIRLALEPLASALAAARLTDTDLATLDALAATLREVVADPRTTGEPAAYSELDRDFHRLIFRAAQRPRLAEIIESLRNASAAYAHLYADTGDGSRLLAALQAQHEQLVVALSRGDAEGASRIAADHVWLTGSRHGFEPRNASDPTGIEMPGATDADGS